MKQECLIPDSKSLTTTIQSESNQPLDFSIATGFLIHNGKILILQRGRKDKQYKLWGIPGGKLRTNESPQQGLAREIKEETSLTISPSRFIELSKAYITNPYDGHYLIYLFAVHLDDNPSIILDPEEHLDFKWASINDFKNENLLVSQRQAFDLVEQKLEKHIRDKEDNLCQTTQH